MTPANITALQALVQADPALAQQLQAAATPENAAQLLAKAASQKGLAVDAGTIADYLKTNKTAEVSDAELEALAGGSNSTNTGRQGGSPSLYAPQQDGQIEQQVRNWTN